MFARGNKGKGSSSDNLPVPQSQRRSGKSAPSIISTDLVIVGTLTSTGEVQIDGRVDGDIRSGSVTLGEKASFEGDVVAESVTVRGRVKGSIRARKVSLAGTCHVEGTVLHEALAVEAGAFFEGNSRHSADPLAEVVAKPEQQRAAFDPKRDLSVVSSSSNAMQKSAGRTGR
ncbi:MAG: polymer-forming cytoskeletal protein [Alphaproteobacteria bacterium]|nr:polymer-forming cytoskeletal protein [Alphaproteobacteria bacterium]